MSSREAVMAKVRGALKTATDEGERKRVVADRLAAARPGVIPARGQIEPAAQVALFCAQAEKVASTVARIASIDQLPAAVAEYLRSRHLPASLRMGADPRLAAAPWSDHPAIELLGGPSDGTDETGLSHAFAAIAETGTVMLHSGTDNPTTVNFLPEHHIVVVDAKDVAGDLETALARVRAAFGKGEMPRTLNLITGPSRSGDVEQKIILGAHGPRATHVIVVG